MTYFESNAGRLWSWSRRALSAMFAALSLLPVTSYAVDTQCAKVKIEITQELTMERQGFDAMMKITNGLTTTSLETIDRGQTTNNFGNLNITTNDELNNRLHPQPQISR